MDHRFEDDGIFSHFDNDRAGTTSGLATQRAANGSQPTPGRRPQPNGRIRAKRLNNGVEVITGSADKGCSPEQLHFHLRNSHSLYWLLNLKRAGLPETAIAEPYRDDLLKSFPPQISRQNSLHLMPYDHTMPPPTWTASVKRDAAICIASDLSRDEILAALRLTAAYFTSPSSLQFQLENANEFALENLYSMAKFFLTSGGPGKWQIFNHPFTPLTVLEIGLPVQTG